MHRTFFSRGKAPKHRYAWQLGERGGIVASNSRSEARSLIKRQLSLPSAARLPIETVIERFGE